MKMRYRCPRPSALIACAALCLTSGAHADAAIAPGRDDPPILANGALTLEPTHVVPMLLLSERERRWGFAPAPAATANAAAPVDSDRDDDYNGRITDSFADESFPNTAPARPAAEPFIPPACAETPAARKPGVPADAARADAPTGGVVLLSANVQVPVSAVLDPGVAATVHFAVAGAVYPLPGRPSGESGASFSFDIRTPMPSEAGGWNQPAHAAPAASGAARLEPIPAAISTETIFAPVAHRMDAAVPAAGRDLAGVSGFQPQISPMAGAAYAWGDNGKGELGNGTTDNSSTPVQVNNLTGGVTAVAAGSYHGLAIQNGSVKAGRKLFRRAWQRHDE